MSKAKMFNLNMLLMSHWGHWKASFQCTIVLFKILYLRPKYFLSKYCQVIIIYGTLIFDCFFSSADRHIQM